MTSAFSRDYSTVSKHPRATLSSILISIGLLTLFITLVFWVSLPYPIGTVAPSYLYGPDHMSYCESPVLWEGGCVKKVDIDGKSYVLKSEQGAELVQSRPHRDSRSPDVSGSSSTKMMASASWAREQDTDRHLSSQDRDHIDNGANHTAVAGSQNSEVSPGTASDGCSVDSECDLYQGQWYYDSSGPLYTNNTCPILTQAQNCQGNGRPDKDYENWRWKPNQCELSRFNATKFMELMSGKTLAFIGDSVARNQMESLMCLLWQVEVPKNRGNRRMQRWHFRSKSVTIIRLWSAWLVHHTSEPFSSFPEGVTKIHLDIPDETFMELLPKFDVVVISNGHWFTKPSVYIINNEIVGNQSMSLPKEQQPMKIISNTEAFRITTETSLTAMVTHPSYSGLTIVTSYSPDHYENGAWNTGGSCTGKVRPRLAGQLVEHEFTNIMYEKQVMGFNGAMKKLNNGSKLKLMDITEMFSYRHDGHPGPYRSPDPNKVTERGPNGRPPPQDCLHWCMPGPIDTWNELMLELMRREFEGRQKSDLACS